jgi:hypothetical protein
MTRYAIDTHGVTRERLALAREPAELRECASVVAAATAGAMAAVGCEGDGLRVALERFRVVHAHALDAVADAAGALGDRIDESAAEARAVELFVTAGFAGVTAGAPLGQGDPVDAAVP